MAVDYSRHAANYDRARADDVMDREFWLGGLVEIGGLQPGERILDLGAGTGRFSHLLSPTNPVVAFDSSAAMLAGSRGKGPFERVLGDGHHLPFQPGSFDATILVMVLHHLADYPGTLREVARVSRRVVLATSDMATRDLGILEEAFPSLLEIDRRRFPPIGGIVASLEAAGFRGVRAEERPYRRTLTVAAELERVRRRYLSTFDLLPPGEFESGLRFLEDELPRRYGDAFVLTASFTFVAATK